MGHLGHMLETFRPVYEELVSAGSKVELKYGFEYAMDKYGFPQEIEFDLLEYFQTDRGVWRQSLKAMAEAKKKEAHAELHGVHRYERRRLDKECDDEVEESTKAGRIKY